MNVTTPDTALAALTRVIDNAGLSRMEARHALARLATMGRLGYAPYIVEVAKDGVPTGRYVGRCLGCDYYSAMAFPVVAWTHTQAHRCRTTVLGKSLEPTGWRHSADLPCATCGVPFKDHVSAHTFVMPSPAEAAR